MKAWTLGSGSRGNSILLDCDGTRVVIDAGYPPGVLAKRLASARIAPESIDAVIVTHEHVDHARGVAAAHKRWGWRVYGTAGTLAGIRDLPTSAGIAVAAHAAFTIGTLGLELVPVPHDATAPAAVVATSQRTGFRAGCAHDLGSVPRGLPAAFARLDLLLIESNHDESMLRDGPYPPFLKDRIASRTGHLSNRQSAALTRSLAVASLRHVVLLHLSETNNTPQAAMAATVQALRGTRTECGVTAAPQDSVCGPFGDGAVRAAQLDLAL